MRKKQIDGQRSQLEENIVMLDSPDGKLNNISAKNAIKKAKSYINWEFMTLN